MEFDPEALVAKLRRDVEAAVNANRMEDPQAGRLLKFYEEASRATPIWKTRTRTDSQTGLAHGTVQRWTADDISDAGERVSHLERDFVFFGHFSIYAYAVPLIQGARVLDVGCGSGYGSAHLAERGAASVLGIDPSETAIAFSRDHFTRHNLEFRRMAAEALGDLPAASVDVVFSSNALEHVADLAAFFRGAWQVLRPDGTLLIAVPPITNEHLLYQNLINPYHVNLWSPRQWSATIARYFEVVTPVLHGVRTIGGGPRPEDLVPGAALDESAFVFADSTVEEMYGIPTLTAIFVARRPRQDGVPGATDAIPFVDDSFTRQPGVVDPVLARRLRVLAPSFSQRVRTQLSRLRAIWRTGGTAAVTARAFAAARRRLARSASKARAPWRR